MRAFELILGKFGDVGPEAIVRFSPIKSATYETTSYLWFPLRSESVLAKDTIVIMSTASVRCWYSLARFEVLRVLK